jgi:hypothetical protein
VRTHVLNALAIAVVAMTAFAVQAPSKAEAQVRDEATPANVKGDEIDGEVAGIVGLGMLGVDIGLILPPAIGLYDQTWAYFVFPAVLGGGAAGAGFVLTDKVDRGVNVAFMAAGLGLFIPALVGTLAWKSNKEEQAVQAQRGVLRFGRVNLNGPSVGTAPVYTAEERARFGVAQRTSTRVTLLSGTF